MFRYLTDLQVVIPVEYLLEDDVSLPIWRHGSIMISMGGKRNISGISVVTAQAVIGGVSSL